MPTIAIVNRSSVMTDAEVDAITSALHTQLEEHLAPIWGVAATLTFVDKKKVPAPDAWWLMVLDNSDQAGMLGYHDITPQALPLGKAFVQTTKSIGHLPSVTLSHELLEMLVDPEINLSAQVSDRIYAYEVCDPCQSDEFSYKIGEVAVSDFVTPEWFSPTTGLKGPFDYKEHIKKPLAVLRGGYSQYMDLTGNAGWQQINADGTSVPRPRVGSRRERRRILRRDWVRSDPTL